jgi:RNA recognition motif-containing protein
MDYAQFYANSMQQQAQYANAMVDDKRTRTIYVGNLSRDVSEQLLESLFSKLGTIIKIYLHRDVIIV